MEHQSQTQDAQSNILGRGTRLVEKRNWGNSREASGGFFWFSDVSLHICLSMNCAVWTCVLDKKMHSTKSVVIY